MPYSDTSDKKFYAVEWRRQIHREWLRACGGRCLDCGSREKIVAHYTGPEPRRAPSYFNLSKMWREKLREFYKPLCDTCSRKRRRFAEVEHGTLAGYKYHKCRCTACRIVNNAAVKRQRSTTPRRKATSATDYLAGDSVLAVDPSRSTPHA